jgi:hypothetical protein
MQLILNQTLSVASVCDRRSHRNSFGGAHRDAATENVEVFSPANAAKWITCAIFQV